MFMFHLIIFWSSTDSNSNSHHAISTLHTNTNKGASVKRAPTRSNNWRYIEKNSGQLAEISALYLLLWLLDLILVYLEYYLFY